MSATTLGPQRSGATVHARQRAAARRLPRCTLHGAAAAAAAAARWLAPAVGSGGRASGTLGGRVVARAAADGGDAAGAPTSSAQASPAPSPPAPLPFSRDASRALRAAREQAARQGLMFAGPDQLLLGVLAAGSAGGGGSAAGALAAALDGGDADSVREWLNGAAGLVAPLTGGGGGGPRASDVELTAAARAAVAAAQERAAAMGSHAVGTAHLALAVLGDASAPAGSGPASNGQPGPGTESGAAGEPGAAAAEAAAGPAAAPGRGPRGAGGAPLVLSLLRLVGADVGALRMKLLALAEEDREAPYVDGVTAYRSVVSSLRSTYARQAGRPVTERDDAAFAQGLQQALTPWADEPGAGSSGGNGGGRAATQQDDDDIYE